MSRWPRSVPALLAGVLLFGSGQGLLGPLLAIRLEQGGVARDWIALVMAAYFGGWIYGSLRAPALVERIGHIRSFSVCAALVAGCALLHGLVDGVPAWALLRLVNGMCIAGVLITVESWLNLSASTSHRGRVLAAYMAVYYLAFGIGPFLLHATGTEAATPFMLAGILFCLAVVPVAHTRAPAPDVPEPSYLGFRQLWRRSPTAVVGSLTSGLILGALYGLGPVWGMRVGLDVDSVAAWMGVLVLGGLVLQWPVGRLSDRIDRRIAIGAIALAVGPACLPFLGSEAGEGIPLLPAGALLGGLVALLYPLSLAHASDRLSSAEITPGGATLVLVSSVGAALGPLAASGTMRFVGPSGLFVFVGGTALVLGLLVFPRLLFRRGVPHHQREQFVAVPRTTSAVSELDPRGD